ncbi:inositol-pentakisphosphate 2-kinase-like [Impatiens glandulifera]|uniref:inositol-pentakisphosphate 2-kinase-like n=1 Tax=Impatiens glandulifera TaxID=253017 RepID=UPI001FB04D7C|nr:inositol-pentakisphosphate 2-kinase-like [Impatiens glandulifera]
MALILEAKDADDWIYRGEGAANLVLAYKGSSPAILGKVLRIQKADNKSLPRNGLVCDNAHLVLSSDECLVWNKTLGLESNPSKEVAQQVYIQRIMQPLLGTEHVDAGVQVLVSREFLELIEKNVHHERPSWRVDASKIDTLCDSAVLISDHCIFPTVTLKEKLCFSVEIKPKWGFLPVSTFIAEENAIKKSISRFKMHQALKFYKNEVTEISEYDPLDMFSGSIDGIHKAIESLFRTPQNNFRFFLNGRLINTISVEFEDVLKGLIRADDSIPNFIQLLTEGLYKSGLLDRLLEIQKLDTIDVEGAIHAYYDVISKPCVACNKVVQGVGLSEKFAVLHSFSLDEKLKIVRDFLISATAKDLSMMITFELKEDGGLVESSYNSLFLASTNQSFYYKGSFIDLDMKSLKKMDYYYELDQRIVTFYTKMLKKEPTG